MKLTRVVQDRVCMVRSCNVTQMQVVATESWATLNFICCGCLWPLFELHHRESHRNKREMLHLMHTRFGVNSAFLITRVLIVCCNCGTLVERNKLNKFVSFLLLLWTWPKSMWDYGIKAKSHEGVLLYWMSLLSLLVDAWQQLKWVQCNSVNILMNIDWVEVGSYHGLSTTPSLIKSPHIQTGCCLFFLNTI